MPILYNFHIFLATFYMIYWTNLLIQCPVPVPVCCMFFVLQNIHIKRSPNAIKIYGDFFGIFVNFKKWNQHKWRPTAPKRHQGAPRRPRHGVVGCAHLVRRLEISFRHKEANYWIKIRSKFQPDRSYGSLEIRNGFQPENRNAK